MPSVGRDEIGKDLTWFTLDFLVSNYITNFPSHTLKLFDLVGIYWGFCRIGDSASTNGNRVYKTACSIGYNPTYHNTVKTVEPHLIAPPDDERRHKSSCGESVLGEFYDQKIRLSLVGYLRPELPFEGLDKLIAAIKKDISDAERLGDGTDTLTILEKEWVASNEPV